MLIKTRAITSIDSCLLIDKLTSGVAGIAQLVERNLAKVEVASSSLVSRSIRLLNLSADLSTTNSTPI